MANLTQPAYPKTVNELTAHNIASTFIPLGGGIEERGYWTVIEPNNPNYDHDAALEHAPTAIKELSQALMPWPQGCNAFQIYLQEFTDLHKPTTTAAEGLAAALVERNTQLHEQRSTNYALKRDLDNATKKIDLIRKQLARPFTEALDIGARIYEILDDETTTPQRRTTTPPTKTPNGQRITVQRACNNCNRDIGDATKEEIDAAVAGLPLPDVTAECGCLTRVTHE